MSVCLSVSHMPHMQTPLKVFLCTYYQKKKKTIVKDLVFFIDRYHTNTKNTGVERPKNSFLLRYIRCSSTHKIYLQLVSLCGCVEKEAWVC